MKTKSFLTFFTPLLAALALASFAGTATAANTQAKPEILIGSDVTFPPFDIQKEGKMTGFDIDMIHAIAKAEDMNIKIKPMQFNGIIPSLQSGAIDVAVSGMFITKKRLQRVDFSQPYFHSGLSILVKKDSPINSFADLKGHVVAAKKATAGSTYLLSHGIDPHYVKQFQNLGGVYQSLASGAADAVCFDNATNIQFMNKHPGYKIVGGLLSGGYYGIAVSKKNPELVATINAGLAQIRKDGEYAKLFDKYFGGNTSGAVKMAMTPQSVALSK